jgi:REP element-mobilizing transposase RayT
MPGTPTYPQRRHQRLADYDYKTPGYYFVTTCIQDRLPLLCSVLDGTMRPGPAGELAHDAWQIIADTHRGIAIDIDVALPDHVHAVIVLEDELHRTLGLTDVVHRYKSLTTKRYAQAVRTQGWPPFAGKLWREGFYDHVIRDEADLNAVRRYIDGNVQKWELVHGRTEESFD